MVAGTSWATGTLPVPWISPNSEIQVAAALAISPHDIWIGGNILSTYDSTQFSDDPFLASYDGTTWRVWQFPGGTSVTGISALGPDDVWASVFGGTLSNETNMLLHWTGRTWRQVRLPQALADGYGTGEDGPGFNAVIAEGPRSVWLVGAVPQGPAWSGMTAPGAAHWDGTRWTLVTAPTRPSAPWARSPCARRYLTAAEASGPPPRPRPAARPRARRRYGTTRTAGGASHLSRA